MTTKEKKEVPKFYTTFLKACSKFKETLTTKDPKFKSDKILAWGALVVSVSILLLVIMVLVIVI